MFKLLAHWNNDLTHDIEVVNEYGQSMCYLRNATAGMFTLGTTDEVSLVIVLENIHYRNRHTVLNCLSDYFTIALDRRQA